MISPIELVKQAKDKITECSCQQLAQAVKSQKLIIDVREPAEYEAGSIGNAINIPRGMLEFAIASHPQVKPFLNSDDIANTEIFLFCKTGGRSALAAQSLKSLGFNNVQSMCGGTQAWEKEEINI